MNLFSNSDSNKQSSSISHRASLFNKTKTSQKQKSSLFSENKNNQTKSNQNQFTSKSNNSDKPTSLFPNQSNENDQNSLFSDPSKESEQKSLFFNKQGQNDKSKFLLNNQIEQNSKKSQKALNIFNRAPNPNDQNKLQGSSSNIFSQNNLKFQEKGQDTQNLTTNQNKLFDNPSKSIFGKNNSSASQSKSLFTPGFSFTSQNLKKNQNQAPVGSSTLAKTNQLFTLSENKTQTQNKANDIFNLKKPNQSNIFQTSSEKSNIFAPVAGIGGHKLNTLTLETNASQEAVNQNFGKKTFESKNSLQNISKNQSQEQRQGKSSNINIKERRIQQVSKNNSAIKAEDEPIKLTNKQNDIKAQAQRIIDLMKQRKKQNKTIKLKSIEDDNNKQQKQQILKLIKETQIKNEKLKAQLKKIQQKIKQLNVKLNALKDKDCLKDSTYKEIQNKYKLRIEPNSRQYIDEEKAKQEIKNLTDITQQHYEIENINQYNNQEQELQKLWKNVQDKQKSKKQLIRQHNQLIQLNRETLSDIQNLKNQSKKKFKLKGLPEVSTIRKASNVNKEEQVKLQKILNELKAENKKQLEKHMKLKQQLKKLLPTESKISGNSSIIMQSKIYP